MFPSFHMFNNLLYINVLNDALWEVWIMLSSFKEHWHLFWQAAKLLTDAFQSVRFTIFLSLWISFSSEFSLCAWHLV